MKFLIPTDGPKVRDDEDRITIRQRGPCDRHEPAQ
jgi:hypothetical protein